MKKVKSIVLKPQKERAVQNRHPWIFSGAIARKDADISPGDTVLIKDFQGKKLALGHYCGDNGLVCRIASFDPTIALDESFWKQRLARAGLMRKSLSLPSKHTNGFRLLHGEADGFSGLVCDIFGDASSIQVSNPGLLDVISIVSDFLVSQFAIKHVYVNNSYADKAHWYLGSKQSAEFMENDLLFQAEIDVGQKTGHFLDQRDNRLFLKYLSHNRRVLDAFCYSGGFSVYALSGGAQRVVSVDISAAALTLAKNHVQRNGLLGDHILVKADCFEYLRTIQRDEFNVIILDPPAFAKTEKAVMRASRGYKDINLVAFKAIASGGLVLTFSCSQHIEMDLFKKIIFAAAKDSGREVKIIKELGQGFDHPVSVYCPQSSYLKGLALYVE
jgi:23S rRNA (cytosine1962-C5)-methyltransferase